MAAPEPAPDLLLMTSTALRVPHVVAYSEETVSLALTVLVDAWALSGRRLSYIDPAASDWGLGVLWARQQSHRLGRPQYDELHTLRQRECMLHRLCQVCAKPALDPDTGRLSWVFHETVHAASGHLSKPPTCLRCIPGARAACPRLRQEAHVYTSPDYKPWGVKGIVFSSGCPARQDVPLTDHATLEFTLARALIVHVSDLRPESAP
ncbi:hypothetical protein ACIBO2_54670 [Nonomuraea sp. NPDC050022]|uniref:hypothetical protein n=1 Tax=Nonomuraea sp. NPDC050022 TaxID=3364358 RepID=UPI0037B0A9F0